MYEPVRIFPLALPSCTPAVPCRDPHAGWDLEDHASLREASLELNVARLRLKVRQILMHKESTHTHQLPRLLHSFLELIPLLGRRRPSPKQSKLQTCCGISRCQSPGIRLTNTLAMHRTMEPHSSGRKPSKDTSGRLRPAPQRRTEWLRIETMMMDNVCS